MNGKECRNSPSQKMTIFASPFLWQLDSDILHEIFSHWINVRDIVFLDTACCCRKTRESFLEFMREIRLGMTDFSYFQLCTKSLHSAIKWLSTRNLKVLQLSQDNISKRLFSEYGEVFQIKTLNIILTEENSLTFPVELSCLRNVESVYIKLTIDDEGDILKDCVDLLISACPRIQSLFISGELSLLKTNLVPLLNQSVLKQKIKMVTIASDCRDIVFPLLEAEDSSIFGSLMEFRTEKFALVPDVIFYEGLFGSKRFDDNQDKFHFHNSSSKKLSSFPLEAVYAELNIVFALSEWIAQSVKSSSKISCGINTVIPIYFAPEYPSLSLLMAQSEILKKLLRIGSNFGARMTSLNLSVAFFDNRTDRLMVLPIGISSTQFEASIVNAPSFFHILQSPDYSVGDLLGEFRDIRVDRDSISLYSNTSQITDISLLLCNHPLKKLQWHFNHQSTSSKSSLAPELSVSELFAWKLLIEDIPIYLHNLRVLKIERTVTDEGRSFWKDKIVLNEVSDQHVWQFSSKLSTGCPLLEDIDVTYFPLDITRLYGLRFLRTLSIKQLSHVFAVSEDAFPYYPVTFQQYQSGEEGKDDCTDFIPHHFLKLASVTIHDSSERAIFRLLEIVCCGVAPLLRSLAIEGLGPFRYQRHFWAEEENYSQSYGDSSDSEDDRYDSNFFTTDWETVEDVMKFVHNDSYLEYERNSVNSGCISSLFSPRRASQSPPECNIWSADKLSRFLQLPSKLSNFVDSIADKNPQLHRLQLIIASKTE